MNDDIGSRILEAAGTFKGLPYRLDPPPDGINNMDCSLLVLKAFAKAGLPFPSGVRTAEQIRQRCTPIGWSDVKAGDCLFFEHTYEPNERPGPDGHVASHIGISYGAGSKKMIDAHGDPWPGVGITDISTSYWQSKIFQAARPNQLQATPEEPTTSKTISGIDVSNWQGGDISALLETYRPEHVVVRASTESSQHRQIARQQINTAVAHGCTVSAYIWAYFNLSPNEHTADAMGVMAGLPIEMFWFDCEGESAGGKLDHWLSQGVDIIERRGKRAGIYTSAPWWRENGDSHGFSRLPLWLADWTGRPNLDPPSLGWFGGWTKLGGRQWTDTNGTLDRNVFDPAVLVPAVPVPAPPVPPAPSVHDRVLAELDASRARIAEILK
jgi:GH25 family lysozyme M1 (1,4-beta-N-acetylmuramidase)